MTKGFLVSEDLVNWKKFPNVRVIGEYLYFFASLRTGICDFYRTKDPESGEFECIPGTFPFWDPNLF